MATHARQQYFADEVSLQKDSREFSIADEVQQKIDGIEEGAQVNVIETVKVNGEPLTPDEDKAVDITVPGVIDNLYSTSVSDALSARQGKVLYDYLQNIASRGRYLSNWNCATGLAMTNPEESPYEYKAGDYYTVSDVAALGGTNYRPDGSEYIIGQASTVVETEDVSVSDLYLYDGTNWLLLSNSGRAIAVDSSLSTTSTNPVENRVITNALNNKAESTDVNTKTFRVTGTNDLVPFQAAYDYFVNGGWPIIIYGYSDTPYQGAYVIDRTSNVFQWSRTEQYYFSNSTESFVCYVKLRPQLSGSTVTGMQFLFNSDTGYLDLYTDYGAPYNPQYPGSPATKKYVDDHAGTTYTAGTNVQISAQNVISATDTTYTEGTGIDISNANVISADTTVLATKADLDEKQDLLTAGDNITIENECYPNTKGPCPKGFHIGMQSEWRAMITAYNNLGLTGGGNWIEYLHLPLTDDYDLNGYYWCADTYGSSTSTGSGSILTFSQNGMNAGSGQPTYLAHPIRPVKDTPEAPDSSWTVVYDGSSVASGAGIFYNATLGLISISSDGTTWYTIADKNLGATTVYNRGDTRSQANCGNRFQWGNCYGFNWSGETVDSTTPVDTTGYGPGNYYYSDVFMGTPSDWSWDWSSPGNRNLWGGDNPSGTQCALTISAQVPEIEVDDEISSISENPVQNKVIKEALDEKVNLGLNKVFDSTTVEIGKWVDEGGMQGSGHHVTIDPNGEVSAYNVTSGGYNEAKLGTDGLTLLENSALGGDETTVISQDGITITEGQTTKTYNFLGNDRIATLSDISGGTTQWGNIVGTLSNQTDLTTYIDSHDTVVSATAPSNPTEGMVWYDTTNDALKAYNGTSWETEGTKMVVLSYGHSTWQDFIDAYEKNAVVYCKASSQSNPGTGAQTRMAFMAFVDVNSTTQVIQGVEFQYYRSRSSHSTAATVLDEVYIYKLTSNGTWTVTQRDTAAEPIAGTGIGLTYNASGMTINNTLPGAIVASTQPSSSSEGDLWYDTTNDILKSYDGTSWNECGGNGSNVEAFFLSSTSDLTNAQAAYDWYAAGKEPILIYNNKAYTYDGLRNGGPSIKFLTNRLDLTTMSDSTAIAQSSVTLMVSGSTVTAINESSYIRDYVLVTGVDYQSAYTPQYAGSPATKKYVDDNVVQKSSTAPSSPTEGMVWYDTTNDQLKVYDGTNWNVTGKEYNAGEGISIGDVLINGRKGPAPTGFHVPTENELVALYEILVDTLLLDEGATTMGTYLKMPMAGRRDYNNANVYNVGVHGYYWSSTPYDNDDAYSLYFDSESILPEENSYRANVFAVRCFKDTPTVPTSSWTTLYDGSSVATGAGVFYNATDELISISGDGQTWYTIQDKNLGATTVYNEGDTLTDANCGYFYQRGNNYGFPHSGTVTTSGTKVDASNYGPGNYYSSSTLITGSGDWSTVQNDDLWGDTTGTYTQENVISNTGVLSVNGQTGDVTISAGDMLYADFNWQAKTGATVTLDLASTITPTANFTVNAPSTIRDGQTYILRVNNGATAYTMTLGTNVTNPYQESLALTADGIDQFVFLAIGGNLELQPIAGASIGDYVESVNGTSGPVTLKTINNTAIVGSGNIAVQATLSNITAAQIKTGTATAQRTVTAAALAGGLVRISDAANNMLANGGKLWAGTQEDYEALTSYDEDTVYLTI